MSHPLEKFWQEESGWGSLSEEALELAEGKLAIDVWNAALDAAQKQIDYSPDVTRERIQGLKYRSK